MIIELYVLVFLGPYGRAQYTQSPPLVLPRHECIAEADRQNAITRKRLKPGELTRIEFVCEVRG